MGGATASVSTDANRAYVLALVHDVLVAAEMEAAGIDKPGAAKRAKARGCGGMGSGCDKC